MKLRVTVLLIPLGLGACARLPGDSSAPGLRADIGLAPITDPQEQPEWSDSDRTVVLISLDGFRPDYRDRTETPTLDRFVAEGVAAAALVPVFPTKTFPNHFTQVTGLFPSEHGIVGNAFSDPESGDDFNMSSTESRWWGGEPIWITAAQQGRKTATVFWPGSETSYDGLRPHHWLPYNGSMPNSSRVAQLLEWLDEEPRLHFATLYFSDVDSAGHSAGPHSAQVDAAVRRVDADLGLLVSGLEERGLLDVVDLVVVSDHGMAPLSRERAVFLDDHTDLNDLIVSAWGPYALIEPKHRPVAEVLAELGALPHATCTDEGSRDPALHFAGSPRIPPILCLAESGWGLTSHAYFDATPSNLTGATHGWAPTDSDMGGVLLARGPHLRRGHSHPAVEAVHLYELLAALLQVTPSPNSGDPAATASMLAK